MKKIAICKGANGGMGVNYFREMLPKNYYVVFAVRSEVQELKC